LKNGKTIHRAGRGAVLSKNGTIMAKRFDEKQTDGATGSLVYILYYYIPRDHCGLIAEHRI